jgi:hypothetical protein
MFEYSAKGDQIGQFLLIGQLFTKVINYILALTCSGVFLGLKNWFVVNVLDFQIEHCCVYFVIFGLGNCFGYFLAFFSNHLDTLSKDHIILPSCGCKLFTA